MAEQERLAQRALEHLPGGFREFDVPGAWSGGRFMAPCDGGARCVERHARCLEGVRRKAVRYAQQSKQKVGVDYAGLPKVARLLLGELADGSCPL